MNTVTSGGRDAIDPALDRALDYLRAAQSDDGEFTSQVCARRDMRGVVAPDSNYFATSQVLWSLGFVFHRRVVAPMRRRASAFVRAGGEGGAWPFFSPKVWRRDARDVDTTACAAAAILSYEPAFDATAAVERLIEARDAEQRFVRLIGAVDPPAIDAVTNANALWLIGDDPRVLGAARWLDAVIERGAVREHSPYYASEFALFHAASRALYTGARALESARPAMLRALSRGALADGSYGDALDTALAVCALHNLGATRSDHAARAVTALLSMQRRDGSWPSCAAWSRPGPCPAWWGGGAWTTALAVEAIVRAGADRGAARR
jgi:hypothetical protein